MTLSALLLDAVALVVGFLVGGTGMGGILIPPALVLLSDLTPHAAMATTLASFIPSTLAGVLLFGRMGHLPIKAAFPLVLGGVCLAGPVALINIYFPARLLLILLSILILFAGYQAFRSSHGTVRNAPFWQSKRGYFCIGAVTGSVAGLTGAGGPLLAIAWMVSTGTNPLSAVGLSMPYSLATAIVASLGNFVNGNVDLAMFLRLGLLQLVAFFAGVYCVSKLPMAMIKRVIAITCTCLGFFLLFETLTGLGR